MHLLHNQFSLHFITAFHFIWNMNSNNVSWTLPNWSFPKGRSEFTSSTAGFPIVMKCCFITAKVLTKQKNLDINNFFINWLPHVVTNTLRLITWGQTLLHLSCGDWQTPLHWSCGDKYPYTHHVVANTLTLIMWWQTPLHLSYGDKHPYTYQFFHLLLHVEDWLNFLFCLILRIYLIWIKI